MLNPLLKDCLRLPAWYILTVEEVHRFVEYIDECDSELARVLEYLLHGIEFGFDIVTSTANNLPSGILGKNQTPASHVNPLYKKAHLQIINEIECGNYVIAKKTPRIISSLAVIPKPDGGVRIIHDCIEIDSMAMELRLPGAKLSILTHELAEFGKRKRASKKQLQSLADKLNWASAVVHGGRVFLRRIIDTTTPLKHDWHKTILQGEI
ncbi:unnamed protein product [Mytilus coruscus]|uniref:Uncharacterized protein n=1 Tax=Mytilus coruscus TaxID=42192 RepID=A0A6J8BL04_MYTCO|nr:unnamed protein product [Mytilus coruscus]